MWIVLIIVFLLVALGGLPSVSGQYHGMGSLPSGIGFVIVLLVVVLLLTGRL